jgi:hypothetical protein
MVSDLAGKRGRLASLRRGFGKTPHRPLIGRTAASVARAVHAGDSPAPAGPAADTKRSIDQAHAANRPICLSNAESGDDIEQSRGE